MKSSVNCLIQFGSNMWIGCNESIIYVWDPQTNNRKDLSLGHPDLKTEKMGVTKMLKIKTSKVRPNRYSANGLERVWCIWAVIDKYIVRINPESFEVIDILLSKHSQKIENIIEFGEQVITSSGEEIITWDTDAAKCLRLYDLQFQSVKHIKSFNSTIWFSGIDKTTKAETIKICNISFEIIKEINTSTEHPSSEITSLLDIGECCWSAFSDSSITSWGIGSRNHDY